MINYKIENDLDADEFISVLNKSTLGQRRPVNEGDRIDKMLQHGNLIITARINGKLVGVSRSLTDFAYCTYLADLAVDEAFQKQGIGKELIRQTKLAAPFAKIILLAAPAATDYYPHIGMVKHDHCFLLQDIDSLK
jgi:predicted N-acetyltransferase YhbS